MGRKGLQLRERGVDIALNCCASIYIYIYIMGTLSRPPQVDGAQTNKWQLMATMPGYVGATLLG